VTNTAIDEYFARLDYDPRLLPSLVFGGTAARIPTNNRKGTSNGVMICTTTQHKLRKNLDAIRSPTVGTVHPAVLVSAI